MIIDESKLREAKRVADLLLKGGVLPRVEYWDFRRSIARALSRIRAAQRIQRRRPATSRS